MKSPAKIQFAPVFKSFKKISRFNTIYWPFNKYDIAKSIRLFICLFIYLFIYLSICLSLYSYFMILLKRDNSKTCIQLEKVTIAVHCNLRLPDVAPVVLGVNYEAHNEPAYQISA